MEFQTFELDLFKDLNDNEKYADEKGRKKLIYNKKYTINGLNILKRDEITVIAG